MFYLKTGFGGLWSVNQKGLYFSKKVCVLVKVVIGNSVWFDFLISGLRTAGNSRFFCPVSVLKVSVEFLIKSL